MTLIDTQIARLKGRGYEWPIIWGAVELLARKENCKLKAYRCSAGRWTCGWGETRGVTQDTVWTEDQADEKFYRAVHEWAERVRELITAQTGDNQFGAMVSFAYNIGIGAFEKSTMLRLHNAGDRLGAARAFSLFNKITVDGKKVESAGLTSRRLEEAAMYLQPDDGDFANEAPMPQEVVPESSPVASPMNQAGAVTAVTGGVTVAASMADGIKPVVDSAADMAVKIGIQPGVLLGAILLATGATVMYWRWKQRKGGWA